MSIVNEFSERGDAERIAQQFHENYERLAPDYGYETREESSVSWEEVPEDNKQLMIATVQALLDQGVIIAVEEQ